MEKFYKPIKNDAKDLNTMEKQETYIYQIYALNQNDFFEIDILNDKIEMIGVKDSSNLLDPYIYTFKIKQSITIKNKPTLIFKFTIKVTEYELKRLNLIAKMKGVDLYE